LLAAGAAAAGAGAEAAADAEAEALAALTFLWWVFLAAGALAAGAEAAADAAGAEAEADAAGACANAAVANRPAIRVAIILVMMYFLFGFRRRDNPVSHEQKTRADTAELTAFTLAYNQD
jgi:heme/copper-type cytochrome/quinol oxidase subunit 2